MAATQEVLQQVLIGQATIEELDNPEFAPLHTQPRFKAAVARAHAAKRRLLPAIEAARARGEVPAYLVPALDALEKRLGWTRGGKTDSRVQG